MSNNFSSNLTLKQLANIAGSAMLAPMAPLNSIATLIPGTTAGADGLSIIAPAVPANGAKLTDPANFQSGNATLTASTITAAHVVRPGHLSQAERNGGARLEWLIPSLARSFAADVFGLAIANITAAKYAAAVATVAPASFALSHVSTLAQAIAGTPRALLVKTQLQQIIAPSLYRENGAWFYPGYEGGVWECSLADASDNAQAVAITPDAIVGGIARPVALDMKNDIQSEEIVLDGIGVVGWLTKWYDTGTRAEWFAVEGVVGFQAGNPAACRFIAST